MEIISKIKLNGSANNEIENKEGSKISLNIYLRIMKNFSIKIEEAKKGLELFDKKFIDEAKENKNSHQNIQNLFKVIKENSEIKIQVEEIENKKIISEKKLDLMKKVVDKFGTPTQVYFEEDIIKNVKDLQNAFSWNEEFKQYFAVKATPNPFIMKILKDNNCGFDCSSMAELFLSSKLESVGEEIMFTSNETPIEEYEECKKLGGIMNLDDISHIDFVDKNIGLPETICFRYNPGNKKKGNVIVGNPADAKYGLTEKQLIQAYKICKKKGIKKFGIHTMVCSNELNIDYFVDTAKMLFNLMKKIEVEVGINFDFINLGGGIGIPYNLNENKLNLKILGGKIKEEYNKLLGEESKIKIFLELGRSITGPYGFLLTKIVGFKETYKNYVGVDSCMANLMRPGMYGAYHHISPLTNPNRKNEILCDVVGGLCENNDKFSIDRFLPKFNMGEILIIHDSGAHGHSMGFNYNGKLRSKEILIKTNGELLEIRRSETLNDYFRTINFEEFEKFK